MTEPTARVRGLGGTPLLLLALALGTVVVGLILYAGGLGARGTDQYWYLADVEALAHGQAAVSNTVFPVGLMGGDPILPPPFIHNVLSIYLAAIPASLVGALGGWLALNIVATLASAGLIFLAARQVASRWAAILCAVLYPLLPVTFWYSAQPLAEASSAFFAALVIWLVTIAGARPLRWALVVAATGLLYLSRESYLPVLLAMPVVFWFWNARSGKLDRLTGLRTTAGLAGLAAAFVVIEAAVLEAVNVTFSYGRLLHTAVPGQTGNMWFNFDLSAANLEDRLPLDLSLLPGKLAGHLAEQLFAFDDVATAVFFWTFNLLVGVALVMAWGARRQSSRLLVIAVSIGLVGVHLLTITLFQNQVRYTLPAIPGLLVVLAMALSAVAPIDRLMRARPLAITLGILLLAALPAGALARVARDDAAANAAVEREAITALDRHLPPTERLLIVYDDAPQVLAYAARPRLVLYLWPEYTQEQLAELVDRFGATWLLAPLDAPLLSRLGQPVPDQVDTIERPGSPWGLYRLDPP